MTDEGIEKFLTHSARLQLEDLNWEEARRVGLTREESFILTYFADIEGQTIYYLRDLLNTKLSQDPEVTAFLTIWNYEEFFHGVALGKLLALCGSPLSPRRVAELHSSSQVTEGLLSLGARLVSRIIPDRFLALYMSWGAINELTTLRGYEEIQRSTPNPVLRELCSRIAKQERRHYAWYFNRAKERLEEASGVRRFVRWGLDTFWTPVGQGVKSADEARQVLTALFPEERRTGILQGIDEIITRLPGLAGLTLMGGVLERGSL